MQRRYKIIALALGTVLFGREIKTCKDQDGNTIPCPASHCPTTAEAWTSLGLYDGFCDWPDAKTDRKSLTTQYGMACAEKAMPINFDDYIKGVDDGRAYYCTNAGAYWLGRFGYSFSTSRCTEWNFLEAYDAEDAYDDGRERESLMNQLKAVYDDYGGCWDLLYGLCYQQLDMKKEDRKKAQRLHRKVHRLRSYSEPPVYCR